MTAAVTPAAPPAARFDRRLIAPMILGAVLNPINSSMIAVALIPIGVALGAPPSDTAWLVSGLYLATAVGQPVVGRLVDTFGPRRLYLVGGALVGAAGLLGTLAPDLWVLVVARILLGLGTCAGYPAAMYLIRRSGADSPAGVLTALAVSAQTISVVGPTLGGLLIGFGGWRTIFAVNVPLAVACLVLGLRRLPGTPLPRTRIRLDLPGIALFTALLTTLLLFLMRPAHWYLLPVTLLAGAALAARESRTAEPFLDLRVFGGNLPLLATYGRNLLSYVIAYGFIYGFTQWLESGRGLSASATGLVLLPTFVAALVVSTLTGRRAAVRGKLVVGTVVQLGAALLLLTAGPDSGIWLLAAVALVAGVPQGLNGLANQSALYHQADPARIGAAAGLLRTFMYLGAIVAAAANGAFFAHGADTTGLHRLALFLLVVAALLLVATVADRTLGRVGNAKGAPS
ncbi:MFS transporter [Asanoa sp. NPDC049573]|uniref:MFS transporter n=1 Tax=Asanoa sp. NPDC049573 TaxID=3155396 RepID=UPI00343C6BD7